MPRKLRMQYAGAIYERVGSHFLHWTKRKRFLVFQHFIIHLFSASLGVLRGFAA
jgi:hypothetical protein